jgi:hypothetical protein
MALLLMVAQKAYDLSISCEDLLKNAIENYQEYHLSNIFNWSVHIFYN